MSRNRRQFYGLFMLLICLTLVTCGETPEPTAIPPDQVSLQLQWVTQAQFAGYYVALDKGWYLEEGIDLNIVPGGPDLVPADLVSSGTRHFGTTLLADLVVSIQEGKPIIGISQIQQRNGLVLIAHKSSGIERPEDLAGKRVGVWLGSWEAQFNALIAQAGLTSQDFDLISQGWSMDPFLQGELDVASAMLYNEYNVVLESGVSSRDLNVIDYTDYGLGFPGDVLFTSRGLAEQNPDLCVRMLRASLRGWLYAVEHPEEAADIVLKYDESGVQTREHQVAMMNEIARLVQTTDATIGYMDQLTIERVIELLLQYQVLSGPVQTEDVWIDTFWQQAVEGIEEK
jgi:NitT/TauT family transport system substrate-binding protein